MKELGIFALAAGSMLSSATPPPSTLDYDLRGLQEWSESCGEQGRARCEVLATGDEVVKTDALQSEPDPVLATEDLESSADDRLTIKSVKATVLTKKAAQVPVPPPPEEPALIPDAPVIAAVRIVVSLPAQKAFVFENGELIASSPVSTGKRGHETPVGTFPILQKKIHHRSNLYSNAPMPYMQRLTNGGIALHAGDLPGYPASHGCIRMPWSFAKKLFGMTNFQTQVTITDEHVGSAEEALELI